MSTRRFAISSAVMALLAIVLAFVPLFGLLGYEFSLAVALTGSFLSVWLGARAASFGRALWDSWRILIPPLVIITLNGIRVRNCDYWGGLAWYALLPGLSVVCGAATGFVCARTVKRPVLVGCLVIVAFLIWGVVRFYRAPAIFGYDPFVGYFAGTLYDEDVTIPTALWWARVLHLMIVVGAVLLVSRRKIGVLPLLCGLVLYGLEGRLGIAPTASDIMRALGGVHAGEHVTIVYQRGSDTEKQLDLVVRDHEFRYAQLTGEIGVQPGHVTSFVFPSAAEKKKWMGAGRTFIAKPWRKEIYVQHEPFPHPVIKHELAHVFAGEFGDPVFHISMRWWPPRINVGLIEGVAVALDWRGGRELSPAGYARALAEMKMEPPLSSIFGVGFLGYSGPRAYTVAGAFCRYLLDTYGAPKLRQLYRSAGDFAGVYGKSLGELEREWRAWLDRIPISEDERELTREAMHAPGVWHKVCAHTIADLRIKADEARNRNDFVDAEKCLEQIAKDDPDEPQNRVALAELHLFENDYDGALARLREALAHPKVTAALRAHLYELEGDTDWRAGRPTEAQAAWQKALALPTDEGQHRTLLVKITMANDPQLREPLGRFFFGESGKRDPALDLYYAQQAALAVPTAGLPVYLLGRGLFLRDAFKDALHELELARKKGLPEAAFERENLRIEAIAAYRAADLSRAQELFAELAKRDDLGSGLRLEVEDWQDRIRWELTNAGGSGRLPAR